MGQEKNLKKFNKIMQFNVEVSKILFLSKIRFVNSWLNWSWKQHLKGAASRPLKLEALKKAYF